MALTRPRFSQLNTSVVAEADPITVLHQGATNANVDVGFLFNRANGLVSNVALYWSESSQSIITAFTSNSGATDSNITVSSYANLTVGNVLTVNGGIIGIVGNLTLGNLISNTGVYAVSSVTSGDAYVGGNLLVVGNITTLNREIVTSVEIVSGNLVANSGTASTSTTTGALVVTGGAGITGNLNVGGQTALGNGVNLYNTGGSVLNITGNTFGDGGSNSGANALVYISQTNSWSGNQPWSLYVTGYSYMNGFRINGQDSPRALHKSITGNLGFSTSDATSGITFGPQNGTTAFAVYPPTSGATVVNYLQVTGAAVNTSPTISALGTNANIDIVLQAQGNGNITTANIVRFTNTNTSTSTNTGALIVAGGAGISGNAIIGGNITTSTSLIPSGNVLSLGGNVSLDVLRIYSNNSVSSDYYNTSFASPQFALVPPQNQYGAAIVQLGQNPRISSLGSDGIYVTTNGALGYAGTTQLKIVHTGSAVNYTEITGGTTGNGPTIRAQGETNVELNLVSRGTSGINLRTGANTATQFRVGDTAGAVNYVAVTGAATGSNPAISAQGSDSNIVLSLQPKGYAQVELQSGGRRQMLVTYQSGNTETNYLIVRGANSGSGPAIYVAGTVDANIDLSLSGKGTGNVSTSSPVVITNANVSTSISTGALIVSGGAGISGNVFSGGYHYVTPTSVTDVAGGTYGTAIAVPGSNWGIYANIGQTGTYYFRQVIGKDASNNIIVGHTGTTALNANINIWPGSGGTGYFNVINPLSSNPVFSVNTLANTVVVANAQASTSNVTGALQVAGGVGVGGNINASGNIYAIGTNSKHGYTWANSVSSAYTVFNSATNSIDTVFG